MRSPYVKSWPSDIRKCLHIHVYICVHIQYNIHTYNTSVCRYTCIRLPTRLYRYIHINAYIFLSFSPYLIYLDINTDTCHSKKHSNYLHLLYVYYIINYVLYYIILQHLLWLAIITCLIHRLVHFPLIFCLFSAYFEP